MKKVVNLSRVALCVLAICSLFMVSCNKENEQTQTPKVESSALKEQEKPIKTFAELDAKVTIEDGILKFDENTDLSKTLNFLQNSNKEEIKKWEESLTGFKSVFSKYEDFLVAEQKDTSYSAYLLLLTQYKDYVVEDENGNLKPKINNGSLFGRFIDRRGIYKVGKEIIKYHKNKVIAAFSMSDIELAQTTLISDPKKGILVHDLHIGSNSEKKPLGVSTRSVRYMGPCEPSDYTENVYTNIDCYGKSKLINEFSLFDNSSNFRSSVAVNIALRNRRDRWFGWSQANCYASYTFITKLRINPVGSCTSPFNYTKTLSDIWYGAYDRELEVFVFAIPSNIENWSQCDKDWHDAGCRLDVEINEVNLTSYANGGSNVSDGRCN